jgi:hypothetical protein
VLILKKEKGRIRMVKSPWGAVLYKIATMMILRRTNTFTLSDPKEAVGCGSL